MSDDHAADMARAKAELTPIEHTIFDAMMNTPGVIDEMAWAGYMCDGDLKVDGHINLLAFAAALIDRGWSPPIKWRSVLTDPPPYNEFVLAWSTSGGAVWGVVWDNCDEVDENGNDIPEWVCADLTDITHWAPLEVSPPADGGTNG